MISTLIRRGIFTLSCFFCLFATAEPISISIANLNDNNQVTVRLELGPQRFDYRYSEDLQISANGTFSFTRDVQVGEFYQLSIADQPNNEICSAALLVGEYTADTGVIAFDCLNRSVTLTSLQGFGSASNNTFSTVVNARFRDTDQAVTGLNGSDFDILQDEGQADALLFSTGDGYFRHVFPLRDLAPRYHWIIVFDLSNSVTAEEIANIKFRGRQFFDSLEVNGSGKIPNHIRITLNSFDEELTTLISESRDIAALKNAINSISPSNKGANQYQSIITSLGQLNTSYTLDTVETGAVIVFTDGNDDVNLSSASTVSALRGNKPLHFVAVGSAVNLTDLRTMAGSDFPQRIIETPDFTSINNRLLESVAENIKHIDGSYLVQLASPARDSATHTVGILLTDQVSCVADSLSSLSTPPCYDNYTGSYRFTSSTASAAPQVIVYGESRLEFNEQSRLRVQTLWSDAAVNYSVVQNDVFNALSLAANTDNTELTAAVAEEDISTTVVVTDNNWNTSGQNQIFSPGFIGIRAVQNGIEGDALNSVSLTDEQLSVDFQLTSVNFENMPAWQVALASENQITLTQITQGDTPQYRLTLTPGDTRLDITNTVEVNDTANGLVASLTVNGNAQAFPVGFIGFINRYGLPLDPQGAADSDNDGVSDLQEFINGTNPLLADSDFDGISDLLEINADQQAAIARHQISMSYQHSCILDDNGVRCFTNDNSTVNAAIENVPDLQNPRLISTGQRFSCAVDDNGLVCWGTNTGSVSDAPSLSAVSALSSSFRHSCALSNGEVHCWGEGDNALLSVPSGLSNPTNLSVGESHACVVDDSGIQCWGDNRNGQLNVPGNLQAVTELAVGRFHSCAIASGAVTCWGALLGDFGQRDVPDLINPRNLRSADNAICVDTDSGLRCWGERLKFVDLTNFNSSLFKVANYAVHPNAQGICAIDLQGLKCLNGTNNNLSSQTFVFSQKRLQRPLFNYGGVDQDVVALRNPGTFSLDNLDSVGNFATSTVFGRHLNDIPVAGDFDGDGTADVATRRPGNSTWYILNSSGANVNSSVGDGIQRVVFGSQTSDIPVPGDYDGDNITDIAFWRPSNGTWYIRNSSGTNLGSQRSDGIQRQVFGLRSDDIPLPGDYDGDRINDLSFWRASNQTWYVRNSSGTQIGSSRQDGIQRFVFQLSGDMSNYQPTMADFDGDGVTDMALMNTMTGEWTIRQSSTLQTISIAFEQSINGLPMPGDYTGDGIADLTVWDAQNTRVTIRNSSSGEVTDFVYGSPQFIPIAAIATQRMTLAQNVTE